MVLEVKQCIDNAKNFALLVVFPILTVIQKLVERGLTNSPHSLDHPTMHSLTSLTQPPSHTCMNAYTRLATKIN